MEEDNGTPITVKSNSSSSGPKPASPATTSFRFDSAEDEPAAPSAAPETSFAPTAATEPSVVDEPETTSTETTSEDSSDSMPSFADQPPEPDSSPDMGPSDDLPTPPTVSSGHAKLPPSHRAKSALGKILLVLLLVGAGAGGVYFWQQGKISSLQKQIDSLQAQLAAKPADTTATDEPENVVPQGYRTYRNEELKFTFAYPEEWGDVTEQADAGGGQEPYTTFTFSANDKVTFGGSGVLTTAGGGRGASLFDCPGFSEQAAKFWALCLKDIVEEPSEAFEITEADYGPTSKTKGFNTDVLVSKNPDAASFFGAFNMARFNVSADSFYGVNLVMLSPTEEDTTAFDQIVKTIEVF